jgi:hypothetical protein
MNKKRNNKNVWEKEHVQRVLNYHNNKYGTQIKIKDKSDDVYTHLKGQTNWDWVCQDTKTNDEIAVEVKRITNPKLEEKSHILWQLLEEVQKSLNESGILKGTFHISCDVPRDSSLLFGGKKNRQELRDTIYRTICEVSRVLNPGDENNLIPLIQRQISFKLPDSTSLTLHKLSDQESTISKGSGMTGFESPNFNLKEIEKFEHLIQKANEQLEMSKAKKTFLVLIEEGYRPINPDEIKEAFYKIEPTSYSQISNVYFVRGEEVTEITLIP